MNKIYLLLITIGILLYGNSVNAYMSYKYPGCTRDDIVIGGQVWAACNSIDYRKGDDLQSGWFSYTNGRSLFTSNNWGYDKFPYATNTKLRSKFSACAEGYRLPNQGEWQQLEMYAKQNNSTVEGLLNLPLNGGYIASKDNRGRVILDERLNVYGSYWTATYIGDVKMVYHIGSTYAGYRTNGTDLSYKNISKGRYEIANIRCIRENQNQEMYNLY